MAKLLVLTQLTEHAKSRLSPFETVILSAHEDQGAWLESHGAEVEFLLTDGGRGMPVALFDALPGLRLISSIGVGYDGIDTDFAVARGIPVCHTPDVLNEEVATTALLLFLTAMRNFEAEMAHARSGQWGRDGALPLSRTADGRKIGILGLGRIGKAIARKLAPFSPEIVYHGRSPQDVPFEFFGSLTDMAAVCNTLIAVTPGGAGTHHLINAPVLEALGPNGLLINVARGSVVDEAAMITALQGGKLGHAALDVFENEPHIPEALRTLPNVTLSPHIGSATVETRRAMADLAIDNLIAGLNGQPLLSPVPECKGLL